MRRMNFDTPKSKLLRKNRRAGELFGQGLNF